MAKVVGPILTFIEKNLSPDNSGPFHLVQNQHVTSNAHTTQ